ncbi:BPI protein, partial [Crypturellus undulatus]|nr:BPI protein [Crypturellus undulatus]
RSPRRLRPSTARSPQMQELYPDRPMELRVWARRQPLLSCRPDGLRLALHGTAETVVLLPNGTRAPAFLLHLEANVTGKPVLTANRIGGPCWAQGVPVGLKGSLPDSRGPRIPQVQNLENLLSFGLRLLGLPLLNRECRPTAPP